MPEPINPAPNEELKRLVEENLKYSQENHRLLKKIKRYMVLQNIGGIIYVVLIILPIILAIIYLPQLLGDILPADLDSGTPDSSPSSGYLQQLLNKAQK